MHLYRTHTCGQLRPDHIGETVKLSGWLHRRRDHGGVIFIDLRDHYGLTQCVFDPAFPAFAIVERLRVESVITIEGEVVARDEAQINPALDTGMVEIQVKTATVRSEADELPLPVFGEPDYPEDIRLTYRYLDLRRQTLHANMVLRSRIIASIRKRMIEQGFTEYQTPILTVSSPEGARDFLVPSRLHPGTFYALPQAPQQFKQFLMIAGFDRYFQIAPCFRDEDARTDRSPGEFYQLDIEMSFVTQEDVFSVVEPVIRGLFEEFADCKGRKRTVPVGPFERITYAQAMLQYGTDKPDLRIPIKCTDVSALMLRDDITLDVFKKIVAGGGIVRAIPAPDTAGQPRRFFDRMDSWAKKEMQAPGLGYMRFIEQDGVLAATGPIAKFFAPPALAALAEQTGIGAGDALFFAAGKKTEAERLQGAARHHIGAALNLVEPDIFRFCWIVDFPMYEYDEEAGKVDFSHNPFSMPQGGLEALKAADTQDKQLALKAFQYDLVCNGVELSSGAIRNHRPDIMLEAFRLAGYGPDAVKDKFGGMLNALYYGVPPHGGIAPGLDRIVMLLADVANIRDVTLFPMNRQAQDLMMKAPGPITGTQLQDLHIRTLPPVKG